MNHGRLVLTGTLLVVIFTASTPIGALTHNTEGLRGQAIVVDNSSEIDGLEVFFNATYLPGMCPDFTDIRFVDEGGATIPHWIEGVTNGSYAHVWLALPADTEELTMCYGSPEAQDLSDPDAVFTFFEDYEWGNLSRWSFCGSNVEIQPNTVRNGTYAGDINVSEPDLKHLANNRICLANISSGPLVIEGDIQVSEFGWWCGSGYFHLKNGTDRVYAFHLRNESMQYYDGVHRNFSADRRAKVDTWYHVEIVMDTPNAIEHVWIDGEYIGNRTPRFSDGSLVPNGTVFTDFALIGSSAWYSGEPHHFYTDNIRVRKYTSIEPDLTYVGPPGEVS